MLLRFVFNVRDFKSKLETAYRKAFDQKFMTDLLEETKFDIIKRTLMGYGTSGQYQKKQKLKPLSKNYIKFRKESKGILSSKTKATKSNLTFTGQMLDSLYLKKSSVGYGEIAINDQRNDGEKNSDIVRQNAKRGRPFFFVTDLEYKRMLQKMDARLIEVLRQK